MSGGGRHWGERKPRGKAAAAHYFTRAEIEEHNRRVAGGKVIVEGLIARPPTESARGADPAKAASACADRDRMNKGEAAYADHLHMLWLANEIAGYWYEPWNLRLAANTYYRPDFLVLLPDRTMRVVDIKGRSGDTYWCEEDSKIKIKISARLFPMFSFWIIWPRKGGGWSEERVGGKL
jgi:hypothetical protein